MIADLLAYLRVPVYPQFSGFVGWRGALIAGVRTIEEEKS